MQDDYDRKKCVALVKEAREITHHLRAETESIKTQMGRVLEGDDDEPLGALEGTRDANLPEAGAVGKSFWQFWR